jgi:hypothetical protein
VLSIIQALGAFTCDAAGAGAAAAAAVELPTKATEAAIEAINFVAARMLVTPLAPDSTRIRREDRRTLAAK